ncbi:STAS domain-containing protein [Magnetospirillum sp. SS-4]|uniref:STAS domain-containing protein n=1 Tax=Magnetospirillum sp. SS-4 TaxID=2681465 RepID=UPI00138370C8|nr:STAS domain-containing protein [Magnetospirillum sp. SS-4]CAA7618755.1 conserved hypothetical protein [Magnetospirillum sp. SS-4]
MDLRESNGRIEIDLPVLIDLPASAELRDLLLDALARDAASDVVLKAQAVERMSTACVQVVLAAAVGFRGAARRMEIEGAGPAVTETFTQLGLAAELQKLI